MRLTFLGAARTVTGSMHLLEAGGIRILVDCGLFQGGAEADDLNRQPFAFAPSSIDYVLLTHAHIDHSGRLPILCRDGLNGTILATGATVDLARVMLPDAGFIQESDVEWHNRRARRAGRPEAAPLYTAEDAYAALRFLRAVDYDVPIELADGIQVVFRDAGHLLGSAILEVTAEGKKVVFSGDLGNSNQPILRDPTRVEAADVLVVESTYGNRLHEEAEPRVEKLAGLIRKTVNRGGNVVIPAFAVERTQDVLYELNELFDAGRLPAIPVYVDSPLASASTEVFRRHPECYDAETKALLASGGEPLDFRNLTVVRSVEESKAINNVEGGAVIISASGMCEAGRIRHHLKHNLWRPESTVIFVGYQARGTLGRGILEGARTVHILGEEIAVKAQIESIEGFSGHADQKGLLSWVAGFSQLPRQVFVVHGEEQSSMAFAEKLATLAAGATAGIEAEGGDGHSRVPGMSVVVPTRGQVVDIAAA